MTRPDEGWSIAVSAAAGSYPVRVGAGVLRELPDLLERLAPAHRDAVISDDRVFDLHGERVVELCAEVTPSPRVYTFPAGEASKNREEWARLTDALLSDGLGRDACVLALGGGVTGDLAGFVAATYMRGIPVVQMPTSLVAMVDASVGGKTGVDVPMGKNLVGAFHPPRFVLADTDLSSTLPRAERSQGLAEAVKHGAILDAAYFEWIDSEADALMAGDPDATAAMVARSVEIKAGVVSQDEKEGGLRQVLNFGHTLGHAIEAASGFRLAHGSAISIGMVLEARLGEVLGVTEAGVADRLSLTLARMELPTKRPEADVGELLALVSRDKKARAGSARYVLLSTIGEVDRGTDWSRELDAPTVRKLLAEEGSRPV